MGAQGSGGQGRSPAGKDADESMGATENRPSPSWGCHRPKSYISPSCLLSRWFSSYHHVCLPVFGPFLSQ